MEETIKKSLEDARASFEKAAKEVTKSLEAVTKVTSDKMMSKLPSGTREHLEKSGDELRLAAKSLALCAIEKTDCILRDLKGKVEPKKHKR